MICDGEARVEPNWIGRGEDYCPPRAAPMVKMAMGWIDGGNYEWTRLVGQGLASPSQFHLVQL